MDNEQTLEKHRQLVNEFVALANKMKDEGHDIKLVSAAMMAGSAIYATYTTSGNEGYLHTSGINKVADIYKKHLAYVQDTKKAELGIKQQK
ncbi:MAG: DUF3144 domain-containing protein [Gammaproteobacteria bacterium]|nr:MAG: DUF3144 domain-containing protein [Gammaproteobacteria bacterium]